MKKNTTFKIFFVALITVFGFIVGYIYALQIPLPNPGANVFISIAMDQSSLPNEGSSYEILRAQEHFSDIVLGWTIEPGFSSSLDSSAGYNIDVTGRRQEKQNLIFYVSAEPDYFDISETPKYFLNMLDFELSRYNSLTNSSYLVALSSISEGTQTQSTLRYIFGFVLLFFVMGMLSVLLWDYANSNRS